jgi:hypothetical protein
VEEAMTIWIEPNGLAHTEHLPRLLVSELTVRRWGWDSEGAPVSNRVPWRYGYAVVLTAEQLRERYPRRRG